MRSAAPSQLVPRRTSGTDAPSPLVPRLTATLETKLTTIATACPPSGFFSVTPLFEKQACVAATSLFEKQACIDATTRLDLCVELRNERCVDVRSRQVRERLVSGITIAEGGENDCMFAGPGTDYG